MIQLGGARLKSVERSILTTKKEETKEQKRIKKKTKKTTTNECTTCTLISAIIRYEYIVLLMCD